MELLLLIFIKYSSKSYQEYNIYRLNIVHNPFYPTETITISNTHIAKSVITINVITNKHVNKYGLCSLKYKWLMLLCYEQITIVILTFVLQN